MANIPGVYNYCNRWCEKCRFADRCSVAEVTPVGEISFHKLIRGWAEQRPFKSADEEDEMKITDKNISDILNMSPEDINDLSDENPVCHLAEMIMCDIQRLLREMSGDFMKWENEARSAASIGIDVNFEAFTDSLSAAEVLSWYQTFLFVKIKRIYWGVMHLDNSLDDEIQSDSNGTAKVVCLGIDDCLDAAKKLVGQMSNHKNRIEEIQQKLMTLRKKVLLDFPNAMLFTRPGFDE